MTSKRSTGPWEPVRSQLNSRILFEWFWRDDVLSIRIRTSQGVEQVDLTPGGVFCHQAIDAAKSSE